MSVIVGQQSPGTAWRCQANLYALLQVLFTDTQIQTKKDTDTGTHKECSNVTYRIYSPCTMFTLLSMFFFFPKSSLRVCKKKTSNSQENCNFLLKLRMYCQEVRLQAESHARDAGEFTSWLHFCICVSLHRMQPAPRKRGMPVPNKKIVYIAWHACAK